MRFKILFVCGRNQWRSPTAERIFSNHPLVEARSAGISRQSRRQVTAKVLEWADLVLVMERKYAGAIRDRFRNLSLPEIDSLEIPDDYPFMDPELVELLESGVEYYLEQNRVD